MPLVFCSDCGEPISDLAQACVHYGRPQPVTAMTSYPLFPVTTQKFIVMSLFTLGLYKIYWSYQNWKRLRALSGENIEPFRRAFFAPFWFFSLFKRIDSIARQNGTGGVPNHDWLAVAYLILLVQWDPHQPVVYIAWALLRLTSFLPVIPIQMAVARINALHVGHVAERQNNTYTIANIAAIIVGGLSLLVLLLIVLTVAYPSLAE
jgi:hypothetical protein